MAARKQRAIKGGVQSEAWRDRIKTVMLINRLMSHVKGEVSMEKSQVTAALGLLKKVAPDLQSVAVGQDPTLEPLKVRWEG